MRYQKAESTYLVASFSTGKTVTITIYKLSDSSVVVNAVAMTEIGSTGMFKYLAALVPAVATEYLWLATDGSDQRAGKIVLGGYPDTLAVSQAAEEADIDTIQADVAAIKADEATIMGSQTTVAGNIATILADIASILSSQSGEEGDIASIAGNVATILSDIASILSSQSGEEADIDTIQADVAAIMASQVGEEADISTILARAPFAVGSKTYTDVVLDPDDPLEGAQIEAYSDSDRTTLVDVQETDVNGIFIFHLNPGTYYLRAVKPGYTIPDWTKVVSA
jgi:hypothetical protein